MLILFCLGFKICNKTMHINIKNLEIFILLNFAGDKSTKWKWLQNINCNMIVLDNTLPELSVNCNTNLIQSCKRFQPLSQIFCTCFSFLDTNMQESYQLNFSQFKQFLHPSTLLSDLNNLETFPIATNLQIKVNKCLDFYKIVSHSTFVRNILWNSYSSNSKELSCSSLPISQLYNTNATKLQFLQNDINQTIPSNCKPCLTKEINTNIINFQKTLNTSVCDITQNNVTNNSKQLRVIEDLTTVYRHKVGMIEKFATRNNKIVEYFMTGTKITTSCQNKDQFLLSLSISQVKPIPNCELDCFATSITKKPPKLNFYETNKITSETQTDVLLMQQNDVSSTLSFYENKNELDDCSRFASVSSQTELCDKMTMSSTKNEITLPMMHPTHCYKTFQLIKELDINKEKQTKPSLSTNTNKQNQMTLKTVFDCRPKSGNLSSRSFTDYSNNIEPDINFDVKPLFDRLMHTLHWRQPSLFVQQPEQGELSFETTFHEREFDFAVPASDFTPPLLSVDSFETRDFPELQTFQDKNSQTSTLVKCNLPNYGQVEKQITCKDDLDFIDFQIQTKFSRRSFSVSTNDNSNSRNKDFIRLTKSNEELSSTNTYFTTQTIPSSSSVISVKNSGRIDDKTHASKFFLNNILYKEALIFYLI